MNTGKGTPLLDKVKRSLLRMASPFEFGSDPIQFDSVISMNIPPRIGRADAAYDAVLELFHENIFSLDAEPRAGHYGRIRQLLNDARENLSRCADDAAAEGIDMNFASILAYLSYLEDAMAALEDLAVFQRKYAPNDNASPFARSGGKLIKSAQNGDVMISDFEMKLYHHVTEFLENGNVIVTGMRKRCAAMFPRMELERYEKAFSEYTSFYRKSGQGGSVTSVIDRTN